VIKNIRHTGIVVSDLERSLCFYRDLLGFKITKEMEEFGDYIDAISALHHVKVTTIKMAAPDGQLIELLFYHSHPCKQTLRNICDIGIAHVAFTVDSLGQVYDRLRMEGIPFNAPPQVSPDGYAKVTFCRAPEGTLIELVEVLSCPQ
jgi:catechol 2,3-dioxygenase-like lactoylglutathione lyase family enzyme